MTSVEEHIREQIIQAFSGGAELWTIYTGENLTLDDFLAEDSIGELPCAFISFGSLSADEEAITETGHCSSYEETVVVYLLKDGPMRSDITVLRNHFNTRAPNGVPDANQFRDLDGTWRRLAFTSADGQRLQREGYRAAEIVFQVK